LPASETKKSLNQKAKRDTSKKCFAGVLKRDLIAGCEPLPADFGMESAITRAAKNQIRE
jgi:hypothetical protein